MAVGRSFIGVDHVVVWLVSLLHHKIVTDFVTRKVSCLCCGLLQSSPANPPQVLKIHLKVLDLSIIVKLLLPA